MRTYQIFGIFALAAVMCFSGEGVMAEEEVAAAAPPAEKFEFQAEVTRLMDIIINSLYRYADCPLFRLNKNVLESRRHHALQNLT